MADIRPRGETRRVRLDALHAHHPKQRDEDSDDEHTFTSFVHRARWFVVSQTIGNELGAVTIPEWDAEQALAVLSIERIAFDKTDGNCRLPIW
jgi:hypothetical protein